MGYLIVALVAVAVAVFAMQNTEHVVVKFLVWEIGNVPVAAVVLASLSAGMLIVGLPLGFKVWRLQHRLRATPPEEPPPPPADRPPSRPFGT